jgi:triacylglycerol lipase
MKTERKWILLPAALLLCAAANCALLASVQPALVTLLVVCGLTANLLPLLICPDCGKQMRILAHGNGCLKLFVIGTASSIPIQIFLGIVYLSDQPLMWVISAVVCICVLALIFWNGIICVYCTSVQLGIKLRLIGILCGMIPIANLVALGRILKTTSTELEFETEKIRLDHSRQADQICKTKYPIVMVHGVFFRDSNFFNYWGRIPDALIKNGANVFYGNQPSAASIADSAQALTRRIQEICQQTGCEKVNLIAHSKGGLDCRYAIAFCDAAPYVASLTTINTPHRGCQFADYLLGTIPQAAQQKVADAYNQALRNFGEQDADFMAAVTDLTSQRCTALDSTMPLPEGILCRSIGSKLNRASGGKFPLNFTYHLVRHFDGANDGLVGAESFQWGDDFTLLSICAPSGISHGDMIDLNRRNLPDFDVREFYVQQVSDLRRQGL